MRYYGREAGLDHYFIRAIVEDAEGRICLAVWERGLYRLAGEKFERFAAERWPGLARIHGLHPDPAGGMWIATEGAGVFYFNDGRFRQWTGADGLPDMLLRAVVADDAGNLWFSSNKGIFGCSPRGAAPIPAGQKLSRALLAALRARRLARQAGFRRRPAGRGAL